MTIFYLSLSHNLKTLFFHKLMAQPSMVMAFVLCNTLHFSPFSKSNSLKNRAYFPLHFFLETHLFFGILLRVVAFFGDFPFFISNVDVSQHSILAAPLLATECKQYIAGNPRRICRRGTRTGIEVLPFTTSLLILQENLGSSPYTHVSPRVHFY